MILWILSSLVLGCTGGSGKELNKNISFQNFQVLDCGRSSSKNANNPTPINSNVKKKNMPVLGKNISGISLSLDWKIRSALSDITGRTLWSRSSYSWLCALVWEKQICLATYIYKKYFFLLFSIVLNLTLVWRDSCISYQAKKNVFKQLKLFFVFLKKTFYTYSHSIFLISDLALHSNGVNFDFSNFTFLIY